MRQAWGSVRYQFFVVLGIFAFLTACAFVLSHRPTGASQVSITQVAVDMDPTGNTSSSLGPTDACNTEVLSIGDLVTVDIVVRGVPAYDPQSDTGGLAGVSMNVLYDPSVISIVRFDGNFMLYSANGNPGPISEDDLGNQGNFRFDMIEGNSLESGDGVVARLTLKIVGAPQSSLELFDLVRAGSTDPGFLDGGINYLPIDSIQGGTVRVGDTCQNPMPTPTLQPGARDAVFRDQWFFSTNDNGVTMNLQAPEWSIAASGSPSHVLIQAQSDSATWGFEMAAPDGHVLSTGLYSNVVQYPGTSPTTGSMAIHPISDQCLAPVGSDNSFTVDDISFSASGTLLRLAASLRYTCGTSFGTNSIELRYHSNLPFVALAAPTNLDFGHAPVGEVTEMAVRVDNTGSVPLTLGGFEITVHDGVGNNYFEVGDNSCVAPVDPGSFCEITVGLSPQDSYVSLVDLHFTDNTSRGERSIGFFGQSTEPFLVYLGAPLFGEIGVGEQSSPSAFTLANYGAAPLKIEAFTLEGDYPGDYRLIGETCTTAPLLTNEECSGTLDFTPRGPGERLARLKIVSNDAKTDNAIPLRGIGVMTSVIWGDSDCNLEVDLRDAFAILLRKANVDPHIAPACPLGASIPVDGTIRIWGDYNCDESFDVNDALIILASAIGAELPVGPFCPALRDELPLRGSPSPTPQL